MMPGSNIVERFRQVMQRTGAALGVDEQVRLSIIRSVVNSIWDATRRPIFDVEDVIEREDR